MCVIITDCRMFCAQISASFAAQHGPDWGINQSCALFCSAATTFVAEVGMHTVIEAGCFGKREGGLMVKAVECCPEEFNSLFLSAKKFYIKKFSGKSLAPEFSGV